MNNDNDLNLHSMTKLSGWLRHWFTLPTRMNGTATTDESNLVNEINFKILKNFFDFKFPVKQNICIRFQKLTRLKPVLINHHPNEKVSYFISL